MVIFRIHWICQTHLQIYLSISLIYIFNTLPSKGFFWSFSLNLYLAESDSRSSGFGFTRLSSSSFEFSKPRVQISLSRFSHPRYPSPSTTQERHVQLTWHETGMRWRWYLNKAKNWYWLSWYIPQTVISLDGLYLPTVRWNSLSPILFPNRHTIMLDQVRSSQEHDLCQCPPRMYCDSWGTYYPTITTFHHER